MKKVLVTMGALAMALSVSSVASADTVLIPGYGCLTGAASPVYSYVAPNCCRKSSYFYYQRLAPKCCKQIVSPCCGAAAPVTPCCEKAKPACGCTAEKPACGCEKAKKHHKSHKADKCKCNLK